MLKMLRSAAGHKRQGISPPVGPYNYYDTTYWEDLNEYADVNPWRAYATGGASLGTQLRELGTWNVGFRPSRVELTVQLPNGFGGFDAELRVYNTNLGIIGSIIIPQSDGTGVLLKNIPLDFSGGLNIYQIDFPTGDIGNEDTIIHDIWFYD